MTSTAMANFIQPLLFSTVELALDTLLVACFFALAGLCFFAMLLGIIREIENFEMTLLNLSDSGANVASYG